MYTPHPMPLPHTLNAGWEALSTLVHATGLSRPAIRRSEWHHRFQPAQAAGWPGATRAARQRIIDRPEPGRTAVTPGRKPRRPRANRPGRRGVGDATDDMGRTGVPGRLPARRGRSRAALTVLGVALIFPPDASEAQIPEDYTVGPLQQFGAENVHPSRIAPGADSDINSLMLTVANKTMNFAPDVTTFTLVKVGEAGKTYAVSNIEFIAFDPTPGPQGVTSGAVLPIIYRNLAEVTNAPADTAGSLGPQSWNPFHDKALRETFRVTKTPMPEAFPAEAAVDSGFAAKFKDFQHVTVAFVDGAVVVDGPIYVRPNAVVPSSTGGSIAYLPAAKGDNPAGMETYYSSHLVDNNGDPYRAIFPLDTNWRPPNFDMGCNTVTVSVGLRELVPVVVPPPPPTVFRSDAAGTPNPTGDHVTVVVVSDGHPFWTAERADVGPGSAWTLDQTAPYAAPAGEPVRITKPLGAAISFRSTVRFAPGQEPRGTARHLQN